MGNNKKLVVQVSIFRKAGHVLESNIDEELKTKTEINGLASLLIAFWSDEEESKAKLRDDSPSGCPNDSNIDKSYMQEAVLIVYYLL